MVFDFRVERATLPVPVGNLPTGFFSGFEKIKKNCPASCRTAGSLFHPN